MRQQQKSGYRRVDWLEIIVFLILFFVVYEFTPRAQEFASRATTDILTTTSRVFDKEKAVLTTDVGLYFLSFPLPFHRPLFSYSCVRFVPWLSA